MILTWSETENLSGNSGLDEPVIRAAIIVKTTRARRKHCKVIIVRLGWSEIARELCKSIIQRVQFQVYYYSRISITRAWLQNFTVAHKYHGNFNLLTAISICSRQFQFAHGSFNFAHAEVTVDFS